VETPAAAFRHLLRTRARRRWARRYRRMLLASDVVFVSHTKSGRTWLRGMLSHLYHQRYGIPESLVVKHDNFRRLHPACPVVFLARDMTIPSYSRWRPDTPIPRATPCLFIARDPRDVAVSFYFHLHKRASDAELARKEIRPADLELPLFAFCTAPHLGVPRVVEHMNRWRHELAARPGAMLLRYEDLRADPAGRLREVAAWMGFAATDAEIAAAVRFGAFDSMRAREREGRFEGADLTPRDARDGDSFKVRRGVVGGYRDYFDDAEVRVLDALVDERLDPFYGYGARGAAARSSGEAR
jgi:alcohol sulfotransferase